MAYLALTGSVDAVLTEDSDLLTYGCQQVQQCMCVYRCRILYSLQHSTSWYA